MRSDETGFDEESRLPRLKNQIPEVGSCQRPSLRWSLQQNPQKIWEKQQTLSLAPWRIEAWIWEPRGQFERGW